MGKKGDFATSRVQERQTSGVDPKRSFEQPSVIKKTTPAAAGSVSVEPKDFYFFFAGLSFESRYVIPQGPFECSCRTACLSFV